MSLLEVKPQNQVTQSMCKKKKKYKGIKKKKKLKN